jgi:excisionase family DNA binding protein
MKQQIIDDKFWSMGQVAERLGVHWMTISRRIKNGELKSFKIGRRVIIPESALMSYLEKYQSHDNNSTAQVFISTQF